MRQVVNLTRQANLNVKSLNMVMKADQFNTHNTFDTFVIGPGNRFPHAASLAVAEAPAQAYNLYLYMVALVLVRHLMHAIGHHVLSNQPNAKVLYTSSENSQMTSSNQFVTMNLKPLEKSIETSTCY